MSGHLELWWSHVHHPSMHGPKMESILVLESSLVNIGHVLVVVLKLSVVLLLSLLSIRIVLPVVVDLHSIRVNLLDFVVVPSNSVSSHCDQFVDRCIHVVHVSVSKCHILFPVVNLDLSGIVAMFSSNLKLIVYGMNECCHVFCFFSHNIPGVSVVLHKVQMMPALFPSLCKFLIAINFLFIELAECAL